MTENWDNKRERKEKDNLYLVYLQILELGGIFIHDFSI